MDKNYGKNGFERERAVSYSTKKNVKLEALGGA